MKQLPLRLIGLLTLLLCLTTAETFSQSHSVARKWNEINLTGIRGDFARPTVTARNLHHTTAAMYDAWAVYSPNSRPYFLGNEIAGISIPFTGPAAFTDTLAAQEMAISFAAYRLLENRYFIFTPGGSLTRYLSDSLMLAYGYDASNTSTDYSLGPAELGNYIAEQIINFGYNDNANQPAYGNIYYSPVNPPLEPTLPGNPAIIYLNSWQPLTLDSFVDQNGFWHPLTPGFQSPEWGNVTPFSLDSAFKDTYTRDGDTYQVYYDPGLPPLLDTAGTGTSEYYQEGFSMVSKWGAHLDPADGVLWDISPASIGKISLSDLPNDYADYASFYDMDSGGTFVGQGRVLNPVTGAPYSPQIVPRGDYARVLAEFWADGPDSETPPGHWYTILNYVNDHPLLDRRWNGGGDELSQLDWDIVSYFTLGGAMHDAAIAAWSIKGYYDYIRPISAIRCMTDIGQCTDSTLANFNPAGMPLQAGFVEIVEAGDPLEGASGEHIGKIKLYTWRGHDYVIDPATDVAGVDWILAENWWPYQRPTFVTPPFAGYVSGHSTFSRAAATVLTQVTGDAYFPGGMGEFFCPANEFLVFEEGPSVDITLQWATYRDASDECSLSRIWGGIHPPADDVPGRKIGKAIGQQAYLNARKYIFNLCTDDADSDGICDAEDDCLGPNVFITGYTPIDESACRAKDAGIELEWTGGIGGFNVTVNDLYTLGPFPAGPQSLIGARAGIPINTVTITDLGTGCTVTDTLGIVLAGPDKPQIESIVLVSSCFAGGTVLVDVLDSAPGFGDYSIRVNGTIYGPYSSEPFVANIPPGTYPSLVLRDENNCVDKDISGFTVMDTCPILRTADEILLEDKSLLAKLNPNPAKDFTYFQLENEGLDGSPIEAATVDLLDPFGKLIQRFDYSGQPLKIGLENLAPGMYILQWRAHQNATTENGKLLMGSQKLIHF